MIRPQKKGFIEIPRRSHDRADAGTSFRAKRPRWSTGGASTKLALQCGLKYSGEDVRIHDNLGCVRKLVFASISIRVVECGGGVNIYFSNLSWDSEEFPSHQS